MANKRDLKKQIRCICGELAGQCVLAAELIPGTDREAFNTLILDLAHLQAVTLAKMSFVFDKNSRAFATPAEYKAAKEAFYASAMKTLIDEFSESINAMLKRMNALLNKEQRELAADMTAN